MKCDWKEKTLNEIIEKVIDYRGKTPKKLGGDWCDSGYRVLSAKNIKTGNIVQKESIRYVDRNLYNKWMKEEVQKGDIFITSEAPFGQVLYWDNDEKIVLGQRIFGIRIKEAYSSKFMYYYMISDKFQSELESRATGTTVIGLRQPELLKCKVRFPNYNEQQSIAKILSDIDDKIAINNKINDNLEKQIMAIFQHMFGEKNKNRKNIRADEYFDISIGKTPPRKEPQWFSKNPSDYVWVSISDMGNCGLYIEDSSEHLSIDAVKMFNIKIVPDNTVILSFKLTVGRVAITDGYMTTNEAIAHFKTDKPKITEYLYCYLKNFNFQTMGSTSSIATAINSKIIKKMSFVVPTNEELEKFHNIAAPMFMLIKLNQRENKYMNELRYGLLPKLMSGEVDISNLNI